VGEVGFDEYACATAGTFARLTRARGSRAPRLVFELGRSLVADSTVLLTRVNYLKRVGSTDWALVDAGMNDFMRPALYGAYHEIIAAETSLKARSNASHSIGGPVCESTDVLGTRRKLGVELSPGDVLAILDVGAYGISMASHYNMRPIPAVVVVSNGKHRIAQKSQPA
jgi:diaminopimelate decarboxylase